MSVIYQKKMIKSDVDANNNKFWIATLNSDCSVYVEWGRVGNKGDNQTKTFSSEFLAEKFINKKISEKLSKGYTEIETIDKKNIVVSSKDTLENIAKKQIRTDNDTLKLIEILTKANVHNIISSTTLSYTADTGLFSTPLGIITDVSINNARRLLNDISYFIKKSDFENYDFKISVNKYLMLIPQRVGHKLNIKNIFGDLDSLKKQNDILDSLEVSYNSYKLGLNNEIKTQNLDIPEIFSCEIKKIDDNFIFNYIKNKFVETKQGIHSASKLNPIKVYSIIIDNMEKSFNEKGKQIGNIKELWHGTKTSNLLSILKSGLIIPPKSNPNVTGRMFGDGLYFSDQSTKALNYSYGYWDGKRDNNCFMFIADVAMGKEYVPKNSYESLPKPGYDSTFAKANESGVINNEMIVYNLHQVKLKYLVEFK